MGLDDREYMRERYRARAKDNRWNDRAGGIEGRWFDPVNRGFDYQNGRFRGSRRPRGSILRWLPFALSLLLVAIPAYHSLKREGWLPDTRPARAFPESGSVTISPFVSPKSASARLTVITSNANAVVQLFEPDSGRHILSLYVRKNERTTTAVPPGTYRMKIIEGQRWHGPTEFFGSSTTYETITELMSFSRLEGNGIDLNRRPDGNLRTRPNWNAPAPL
ncbi:hypothetical protein [Sphingobium algorifonticola]|uniref:Uncharacterized protein n=1 Tax=Sphingobium algorifonticola TaxID=2008318 RepID=A0A437J350_9SPHN|nr:hypothetical protein [Sphingobium algorifonticola]RVT38665.1 hypothetical protein ENE74_17405 [Sphingobium algorifonticola]